MNKKDKQEIKERLEFLYKKSKDKKTTILLMPHEYYVYLEKIIKREMQETPEIFYTKEQMDYTVNRMNERENRTKWIWGITFFLVGILVGIVMF